MYEMLNKILFRFGTLTIGFCLPITSYATATTYDIDYLNKGVYLLYDPSRSKVQEAIDYYEPAFQQWNKEVNSFNIRVQLYYADALALACRSEMYDYCESAKINYNHLEKLYDDACISQEGEDECQDIFPFKIGTEGIIKKELKDNIENLITSMWEVEYLVYKKHYREYNYVKAAEGWEYMLNKFKGFQPRKKIIIQKSSITQDRLIEDIIYTYNIAATWLKEQGRIEESQKYFDRANKYLNPEERM